MAARRGGLSAVSVVLLAPALALLGNIATNTVEVSWRWWPLTVWIIVALLVAGSSCAPCGPRSWHAPRSAVS